MMRLHFALFIFTVFAFSRSFAVSPTEQRKLPEHMAEHMAEHMPKKAAEKAAEKSPEQLVERALSLHLDESKAWHLLLNYKKGLLSGFTSQATDSSYFVDPVGRTNPRAELIADLRGFFSTVERHPADPLGPPQTVRCQFPARWHFLSQALQIQDSDLPAQDCSLFEKFKNQMGAHSATLVFSSYFINNPSSVFGHTLLRLNHYAHGARSGSELIDNGVGYAANPTTSNPVLYTLYGFFGGFNGVFSNLPYFRKVHEYNDFESRDLWEYDLNLTQEEIDRVVEHIWEVGSTVFPYFYLTENCSYHILAVLEAGAPRLNLLARLPFYVVPIDTVRVALSEPGLVGAVRPRPSIHTQFFARYDLLRAPERRKLLQLMKTQHFDETDLKDLEPGGAARVADALLDHIDLVYGDELEKKDLKINHWKQSVLLVRTRLPNNAYDEAQYQSRMNRIERPDSGHRSARFSAGFRQSGPWLARGSDDRTNGRALTTEFRFALHDLLDPLPGYPPLATVEFFKLGLHFGLPDQHGKKGKTVDLDVFRLMDMTSLTPLSRFSHRISWRFDLGADPVRDQRCASCSAGVIDVLAGVAAEPFSNFVVYGLAGPKGLTSTAFFNSKFQLEGVATLGARLSLTRQWSLGAEATESRVFDRVAFSNREIALRTRISPDLRSGIDLQMRLQDPHDGRWESNLSYMRYF
jgi:hypothetical protein